MSIRHACRAWLTVALAAFSTAGSAVGLLEAYQSARQNDPTFRAARFERDAGQYAIDLGRSGLLPVVAITGSWSSNRGERRFIQRSATNSTQDLDYRDRSLALTLRQPLFNYDSIVRYRQGHVQAAYSDAIFDKKDAELAMRLVSAYFDALLAMEKLALSEAEVAAYAEQRQLAERRRRAGEGTVTEIAEAESRLQLGRAGQADALDRLSVARHKLQEMTGATPGELWPLRADFQPTGVLPAELDEWYAMAQEHSPEIRSRRKNYEFADLDVDRLRSGHLPQLDLVGRVQRAENESLSTLDQRTDLRTLGVQLTIPLLAGGRVIAQSGQAVATRSRAQAELEAAVSELRVEIRRLFLAVQTGGNKVAAYQQAVDASAVATEGARRGLSAGIRTNTEVLDAERLFYSAKRDLAQARYEVLAAILQLKAVSGILAEKDLAEVASLLVPR